MTYSVVLAGSIVPGADLNDVRARLARSTGQDLSITTRLLAGTPSTIKRGISQAEAERIVAILQGIGAVAYAELETETFTIDDPQIIFDNSLSAGTTATSKRPSPLAAASAPAYIAERSASEVPQSQDLTDKAMYRAIVGPKNADKYIPFFLARDAGGTFFSWHWPGFFVQFAWALYRKCWGFAFGGLILAVVVAMIIGFVLGLLLELAGASEATISTMETLSGWVGVALIATTVKGFYHRKAQALIRATARISPPAARLAALTKSGGTSPAWVWLFLLIPIIGIVAAIALPAYQDYVVRAKVSEVMNAVEPLKAEIVETYNRKGTVEEPAIDVVMAGPSGRLIKDIKMYERGSLLVTFNFDPLRGKSIGFGPSRDGDEIKWSCMSDEDIAAKFLPMSCRQ